MEIDTGAPVRVRAATDVAATPEVIWEVLADVERWPSWNPEIRAASLEGPLASGTRFRWKSGPGTITSTLAEVDPPHRIAWTGKTLGIKAVHVYSLEPQREKTRVVSEESWDGLLVRLLRGSMRSRLQSALDSGLASLKTAAERRAAEKSRGAAR